MEWWSRPNDQYLLQSFTTSGRCILAHHEPPWHTTAKICWSMLSHSFVGFLDSIETHLWFDSDQWLWLQWTGDTFLMDDLSNLPGIMMMELVTAQKCWLYLGATMLADICTSQGTSICKCEQSVPYYFADMLTYFLVLGACRTARA